MLIVPISVVPVLGVNATEIVQLLGPFARTPPHVELGWMAKSELLDMTPIVTETALLLVTVIDFAALVVPTIWLENARPRGVYVIGGATPIPTRLTGGAFTAPAVKVTVSMRWPRAVGVKVIATVQDPPAARVVPAAPHIFPATTA